jgi:hypothetical protein
VNFKILLIIFVFFYGINGFIFAQNSTTIKSPPKKEFFFENLNIYTKIAIFNDSITGKSKISNIDEISTRLAVYLNSIEGLKDIALSQKINNNYNATTKDFIVGVSVSDFSNLEFKYFDTFTQQNRIYGFGVNFLINIKPSSIDITNYIYPYIGLGLDFTNFSNQNIAKYKLDPVLDKYIKISNIYKSNYFFDLYSLQVGFNIKLPIKNLSMFTEYQFKYGEFLDTVNIYISSSTTPGVLEAGFSEDINLKNTVSSHNFGIGIKYIVF